MKVFLAGVAGAAIAVVVVVVVVVILMRPSAVEYCDLFGDLDKSIRAGENVVSAVQDFLDADPASLVEALPEAAQDVARTVISVAQAIVRFASSLLGKIIPTQLLDEIASVITKMAPFCETLG